MTSYEPGDVVLVPFPFTDLSGTKKRPCVVVSSKSFHHKTADLIVMPITSQSRPSSPLDVTITRWQEAGLLRPSVIKPTFSTLLRSLVLRPLGKLEDPDLEALRSTLPKILPLLDDHS